MDLAAIPWRKTRHPGVDIHFYASDERTGRVVALIRMEPGRGYPGHRHVGDEDVLVVQGSYRDLAGDHPAGSFVHYDAGSSHSPAALGGQRDAACVLLAVAHEGILPLDD